MATGNETWSRKSDSAGPIHRAPEFGNPVWQNGLPTMRKSSPMESKRYFAFIGATQRGMTPSTLHTLEENTFFPDAPPFRSCCCDGPIRVQGASLIPHSAPTAQVFVLLSCFMHDAWMTSHFFVIVNHQTSMQEGFPFTNRAVVRSASASM